ncbi:MAG: SdpI family protein [Anaerolineae bacterium]|nr:SdpI family protein [Anaerolineae bacterium]
MKNKSYFGIICVIAMFIISALAYPYMGERVPIHWNIRGEIDGWGSPWVSLLTSPVIGAIMLVLFNFLPKHDPIQKDYRPFSATISRWNNAIMLFFVLLHGAVLGATLGWNIPMPQLIVAGVGLLLAFMGNEMRRIEPNSFYGIRMPWTVNNPAVWRESHRVGGRVFVIGGLLMALTALLPVNMLSVVLFNAIMIAMIGGTIGYSWWVAQRLRD